MPRIARVAGQGEVQHVISRFVDRDWYLRTDVERRVYLRLLARALADSDWRCLAYCLMSNHLHFAMVAGEQPLEAWAKAVNSPFAAWLNKRYRRLGPVFADRPWNGQVPPERVRHLIAYVHNNPVRAGVVETADASTWSSHRHA